MRKKIFIGLTRAAVLIGGVMLILSLIPGDLSPLSLLKKGADFLVKDGDFESIDLDFYNRIQNALLWGAVWFLITGSAAFAALRFEKRRLANAMIALIFVGGLAAILAAGNLALLRRDAVVYRYLTGAPIASGRSESTPTPPAIQTPTPLPTLAVTEPGEWKLITDQLRHPVVFAVPHDGSGRLFIGQRPGEIRIIENGQLLPGSFINLTDRVIQERESDEQGFLGMAFHPQYADNGFFYVSYINTEGNTLLSRFKVSANNPNRADPDSEQPILGVVQLAAEHNGGAIKFGPDGYLYIGLGDGGIQKDPYGNGQSTNTVLGKILRIDVDHGTPYAIPPDNPFADAFGSSEFWLFGFRNPWQFSFDPLTGDLYIGDVGHNHTEEIDFVPGGDPGGGNFGWSYFEGTQRYEFADGKPDASLELIPPVWTYEHERGYCAVIGGEVYRGEALPDLQGVYLYGDFCTGVIWGLRHTTQGWENEPLFDTDALITSFGLDEDHEIYLLDISGRLFKLENK